MEKNQLNAASPYKGSCIILITKHAKSVATAPPFWDRLGASMLEYVLDTELLGIFSGEVEREGSTFDCVRRKCEWGLDRLGADYGLASDGSFGPLPAIPFIACDHEVLHFIDRNRGFQLSVDYLGENTNYRMQVLNSLEELERFAAQAIFPSHAVMLRPNLPKEKSISFKGVDTYRELEYAFQESLQHSLDGKVWAQSDMRAHMNPSRMHMIGKLADKLAQRLATPCPRCTAPGWGRIRGEKSLPCEHCTLPTEMILTEFFGCVLCAHTELVVHPDRLKKAPQQYCPQCNP